MVAGEIDPRAWHQRDETGDKVLRPEQDVCGAVAERAMPLPRAGLAADIAAVALFLASDEGSFVNGHDLVVDGGRIQLFRE